MIDTQTETLIPINKAPGHFPTRPHVASIWRWIKAGVRGIRLETVLIGGKRFTSAAAIARFISATTAASDPQPVNRTGRSPSRMRAIELAERELAGTAS